MKTAKRTLSILLAVLLLLGVCPAAFAAPAGEEPAAPEAAAAAAPVLPDAPDALIQRERTTLQKVLPKSERLTGIMHTAADGTRMYYVEGEASVYGLLPARWVYADGSNVPPEKEPFVTYQANAGQGESFPASWDARTLGYITPVESQIGGTCWAHAAAATMEANAVKKGLATADAINISEYQMVWFGLNGYCEGVTDSRNDGLTYDDLIDMMDRGGNYGYIGYAVNNHAGPALESRYNLDESLGKQAFIQLLADTFTYANRFDRDYAVTGILTFPSEKNAIKSAVIQYGAVQISYYDSSAYYSAYWNAGNTPNAYYYPTGAGTTNHAVTLVGWDDSFSRENFKEGYRPAHDGAWLIKNSWGTNFGNGGYFWISYDDSNVDHVVVYETAPLDDRQNVYTYNGFLTPTDLSCTAAGSIFTAAAGEYLTYVTSGEEITGTYTFKVYTGLPANAASPEAGTLKYTQSGTAAGEKWIAVNGNVDLQPGERFSVVFEDLTRVKTEGTVLPSNYALNVPVGFNSHAGETFAKISGTWQDTSVLGKNNAGVSAFTRDIGGAPYAVTFSCPGYHTETVTTMTGTVALPETPDHTWVCTYHGQPFDGTGVDRNMTVTAHCYPNAGTVSAASACVTEFRCIYCGEEQKEAVALHNETVEVIQPTREHPGYTRYTCAACGAEREAEWTIHPDGQGAVEGNYIWQYYDGALSFAGTGALPDFTGQDQPRPWDVSRAGAVDLYIGEGITRIGEWNFCYQSALKNIYYPSTLRAIGETAFFRCNGLTEAVLPATVTEIGKANSWYGIFYGCSGIRRLILEEGLVSVDTVVYYAVGSDAQLEEIVLPSTLRDLSYVFYYSRMDSLQRWTVSPENSSFKAVDGVLYNKSGTRLLNYPASRPGVYYKIPATVTSIGQYAFAELNTLKYLDLSETGVQTLNYYVFNSTRSLANLNLPAGLRTLGARTFKSNAAVLSKLFIPSSLTACESLAFSSMQPITLYTASELSALGGLNVTNVTVTVLPGHVHDYTEVAETVPGTCADPGYEIRVCACGQFTCVETATGGHDWQWVNDIDPTCGTPGVKHKECSVCHAKCEENTVEPATGDHNWDWVYDTDPTCVTDGIKHKECSRCHAKCEENTVAPATGDHNFTAQIVNGQTRAADATCTSGAKYYFSCEGCGLIDRDDNHTFVSGDPIEHSWDWVYDVDPTCGTDGVKHKECSRCHAKCEENTVAPATGDHNWDWVYDLDPTCGTDGVKHKECSRCHAKCEENTVAPATGTHTYTEKTVSDDTLAVSATCTAKAKYYFTCSVCGNIDRSDTHTFESGSVLGHSYALLSQTDSTCTVQGEKKYKCSRCGDTYTEKLPLAEHTPVAVPGKSATCTETGLTDGVKCSECGAVLTAQTVIAKKAHSYGAWAREAEPTCTADGVEARYCSACGARDTRSVNKLGHVDSNGDYRCDRCNAEVGSPQPQSNCVCGQYHTGSFASILIFFHRITYFFKNLFK